MNGDGGVVLWVVAAAKQDVVARSPRIDTLGICGVSALKNINTFLSREKMRIAVVGKCQFSMFSGSQANATIAVAEMIAKIVLVRRDTAR